jgi:restriction system protein
LGEDYLSQAGLLEATKRAYFRISDRGRKALGGSPKRIDNEYLSQFGAQSKRCRRLEPQLISFRRNPPNEHHKSEEIILQKKRRKQAG